MCPRRLALTGCAVRARDNSKKATNEHIHTHTDTQIQKDRQTDKVTINQSKPPELYSHDRCHFITLYSPCVCVCVCVRALVMVAAQAYIMLRWQRRPQVYSN